MLDLLGENTLDSRGTSDIEVTYFCEQLQVMYKIKICISWYLLWLATLCPPDEKFYYPESTALGGTLVLFVCAPVRTSHFGYRGEYSMILPPYGGCCANQTTA